MTGWPTNVEPVAEPAAAETQEEFIARRNGEINTWLLNKQALETAKVNEMAARKSVTATLFPNPSKGTQRYALPEGYGVKLVHKLNAKLGDKDKLDDMGIKIPIRKQVQEIEDKILELGPVAALLIERILKWTPELSLSEFEKLNRADPVEDEIAVLLESILTITPASPTLEFEEPKE